MASKTGKPVSLRRRAEFLILQKTGRRIQVNPWLILNFKPNDLGYLRVGWTFPRYVGGAVVRNRMRRWGRELVRSLPEEGLSLGLDINVVLRKREKDFFKNIKHDEFTGQLAKGFKRLYQQRQRVAQ